jgi:AraC-like DNA-binding protein
MSEKSGKGTVFKMYKNDSSGISFEHWSDNRSVGMHQHRYYEVVIMERGTCQHIYRNADTLLITGDAVIVHPGELHGLSIEGEASVYNCQFREDALAEDTKQALGAFLTEEPGTEESQNGMGISFFPDAVLRKPVEQFDMSGGDNPLISRDVRFPDAADETAGDAEPFANREDYYFAEKLSSAGYVVNSSKQGVIHLSPDEFAYISKLLRHVIQEENEEDPDFWMVLKKKYMEMILLELRMAQVRQNQIYAIRSKENQTAISEVLINMENNLTENVDFDQLAKRYGFSTNYFRKIFKDVTGLSPVKYVNRLRIIRACAYIQSEHYSLKDAAAEVGIYDFNYFSRLFRQVMGFPPSRLN